MFTLSLHHTKSTLHLTTSGSSQAAHSLRLRLSSALIFRAPGWLEIFAPASAIFGMDHMQATKPKINDFGARGAEPCQFDFGHFTGRRHPLRLAEPGANRPCPKMALYVCGGARALWWGQNARPPSQRSAIFVQVAPSRAYSNVGCFTSQAPSPSSARL